MSGCPALSSASVLDQSPAPESCSGCPSGADYLPTCVDAPREFRLTTLHFVVSLELKFASSVNVSEVEAGVFQAQAVGASDWTNITSDIQQVL